MIMLFTSKILPVYSFKVGGSCIVCINICLCEIGSMLARFFSEKVWSSMITSLSVTDARGTQPENHVKNSPQFMSEYGKYMCFSSSVGVVVRCY